MNTKSLSLYHYQSCPFCARTRNTIEQLSSDVELRDIQLDSKHREDLMSNGGKTQVPCLLIEEEGQQNVWLYESEDIIRFLADHSEKLPATA